MQPKFIANNNEPSIFGRKHMAIGLLALGIGAHLLGGISSVTWAWLHHREDLNYIVEKGANLQMCVDGIYKDMITKRIQFNILTEKALKLEQHNYIDRKDHSVIFLLLVHLQVLFCIY